MKWEDKQVLFEARIKLTTDDLKAADEDGLSESQVIEQAVQNLIGSTGAQITCVFEED